MENTIPGYKEIMDAIRDEARYQEEFHRMMYYGGRQPEPIRINSACLLRQYPRAACYIKAERFARAADFRKAEAGRKAMELLLNGGTIEEANNIMDNWLPPEEMWF